MAGTAVIGAVFVDIKGFPAGRYDPHGRNLGIIKTVHGGVCRNVAENFANVGMPVSFIGMMEDSAIGRDVEQHLAEIGVDLSHTVRVAENGIGMWMVILDENGCQAGSISKIPDMRPLEEYLILHGEEIVKEADSIVLEVDLNEAIAERIFGLAEKYQKKVYTIVANLSVIRARPDLLTKTDCFICNEIEAAKLFGVEAVNRFSPEELLEFLPAAADSACIPAMVVTMGDKGLVFYDGRTKCAGICPICRTEVVDTSGAGDAFFSGTVMSLLRGLPLQEAVRYGTKLASMTIGRVETVCPVCKDFFGGKETE